ncbi:MAG: ABC transporter ATP-binding protein [Rubellimicrobium sp.]|jgi:capsular polysaccharide transport system ATP-binding protein|nr:ABC transporter ATP-binding protein [Rubellimicrobium sp.]
MIVLQNLTKTFVMRGQRKTVLDNVSAVFPGRTSVGLLGRNGAGKSTLLKMIAGTTLPTSGQILTDGRISFPVGFAGSFHPDLTGAQNTRFVARVYGVDTDALMEFVRDFAELGVHFNLPIRSYSSGMKSRLAFGVSMGLQFDTYLIDEVTAVGDAAFQAKSAAVFIERMKHAGSVFVTHSPNLMRELCTAGAVIDQGRLTYYDDIEEAIEEHLRIMHGIED